jgi:hypothetical protein
VFIGPLTSNERPSIVESVISRMCLLSRCLAMGMRHNISIQSVPGGKINILGGYSMDYSKQKSVYVHVSYFERFPKKGSAP